MGPFRVFDRGKMQAVKIILERSGCFQYAEVFQEKGYDSAGHLLTMGPNDSKELQQVCDILPGHMHRLRSMLTSFFRVNFRGYCGFRAESSRGEIVTWFEDSARHVGRGEARVVHIQHALRMPGPCGQKSFWW